MASKEVLNKVENTLDTTAETLDTLERIPKLALNGTTKKQQAIILGTVAGGSLIAGMMLSTTAHKIVHKLRLKKNHKTIEDFAAGKDVS